MSGESVNWEYMTYKLLALVLVVLEEFVVVL